MSGAHIWQTQPEVITDIYAEETADVVVIGAGQAGVVAAQSAAEAGASVICAEKFGKPVHIFYNKRRVNLSAMLSGDSYFHIHPYSDASEVFPMIDKILGYE